MFIRLAWWMLAAVLLAGCRIPGYGGPSRQALANSRHYSQRGVASLERGQLDQAETLLAKAVKTCPSDPEAHRHYAEALWQRNARDEALQQVLAAEKLDPENALIQVRLADMRLAMGQLDAAREAAEKAIQWSPKLPEAWAARGRVLRAGGDLAAAQADLHRALSYAPDNRAILLELASLYQQMNLPHRALQTLQTVAESYTPGEEPADLLAQIGTVYFSMQRYDDAANWLQTAIDRGQRSADAWSRLAQAQLAAGRPMQAERAAQEALAIDPQIAVARDVLGQVALARRDVPLR